MNNRDKKVDVYFDGNAEARLNIHERQSTVDNELITPVISIVDDSDVNTLKFDNISEITCAENKIDCIFIYNTIDSMSNFVYN